MQSQLHVKARPCAIQHVLTRSDSPECTRCISAAGRGVAGADGPLDEALEEGGRKLRSVASWLVAASTSCSSSSEAERRLAALAAACRRLRLASADFCLAIASPDSCTGAADVKRARDLWPGFLFCELSHVVQQSS